MYIVYFIVLSIPLFITIFGFFRQNLSNDLPNLFTFNWLLNDSLESLFDILNVNYTNLLGGFILNYISYFVFVNLIWVVVEVFTFILEVARLFIDKAKNLGQL